MSVRQNQFGDGEFINNSGGSTPEAAWINVGASGIWTPWNQENPVPPGQGQVSNVAVPLAAAPINAFQVRIVPEGGNNLAHYYRWTAADPTAHAVRFQFSHNPGGYVPTMTAQDVDGNGISGTWTALGQ